MKKLLFPLFLLLFTVAMRAQIQDPVKFKSELKTVAADEAEVVFTAAIDKGWHVYSTDLDDGGPISATFNVEKISGAEVVGKLKPVGKEISTFDKLFEMKVRYFENTAQFVQKLKLTGGAYQLEGYLEYGACNDENCLPPTQVPFQFSGKAEGAAKETTAATAETKAEEQPAKQEAVSGTAPVAAIGGADGPTEINVADKADLWKPVISELQSLGETTSQEDMSWIYIFITGFAGGLLALFTPCVWPIIPMTVSFFLKRSKDKKKGIRDAWTYGASIVVIYVTLGLAITLVFGASALNALSTNAVFNILFCLMLVVFAASFFGAFEITLPSKWSTAVDSKAEATSGLLSIFLMAFTLSLVSFSCTGPIIGFLLVQVSTTGSVVAPAIGMLGFAIALALPFTLFALFPSWLKSMPKSGGWMNIIKVTLGFLELAFALKFLSVADLAYGWRILDRETFLALWIVLFALLGFYLAQPTPSTLVLDKLSAIAVDKGVQPVIVCTKGDLAEAEFLRSAYEKSTLPFIRIDYATGEGLDDIKHWINGRLCAFCGNSGVGKSTLLNALLPDVERQTAAISQKLGRGRHTTREVTIFEAFGGRIADTPGFASLEASRAGFIPKENLEHAFPEFGPYLGECQFTGCSHRSEKGCAVRAALAEGKLSQTRYDSYCAMYDEVKDVKEWQRPRGV